MIGRMLAEQALTQHFASGVSRLAVLIVLAGLGLAARDVDPAAAQDASATAMSAVYGDWTLHCQTGAPAAGAAAAAKPVKVCEISSTVSIKGDNGQQGVAAVLSVGRDPDGRAWRVAAELPISAWLPNGVKLQDAANTVIAPMVFTACRPQLCGAAAVLDAAAIAKVKAVGEKLYALYRTQAGQNVRVAVSMNGFPAALDALTANLGK